MELRSLDLKRKHVARAWMAATFSAALILIFGILALAGVRVGPELDAWILVDVAILGGLAFGVAKRSRVCAVLLLTYGVGNEVYTALSGGHFSILRVVFIYFYFRGAIQIFQDHRHAATSPTVHI
jgi:hypothetical protein